MANYTLKTVQEITYCYKVIERPLPSALMYKIIRSFQSRIANALSFKQFNKLSSFEKPYNLDTISKVTENKKILEMAKEMDLVVNYLKK